MKSSRKSAKAALISVCLLVLAGCGNRGLPEIKPEVMANKHAVYLVTSGKIKEDQTKISEVLERWHQDNQLVFNWKQNADSWSDEIAKEIEAKPYDYVYVMGDSLLDGAAKQAEAVKKTKFILLQNKPNGSLTNAVPEKADNVQIVEMNQQNIDNQMESWVKLHNKLGDSIIWLAVKDKPIPKEWNISNESDRVVYLDTDDKWLDRVKQQVTKYRPNWVVLYAGADETKSSKLKALNLPLIDTSSSFSAEMKWDAVLDNQLGKMNQEFRPGIQSYTEQEFSQLKFDKN